MGAPRAKAPFARVSSVKSIDDFEGDVDLHYEGGCFSVGVSAGLVRSVACELSVCDIAGIPAIGDHGTEEVFTFPEMVGDVVSVVAGSFGVIGPTGGKEGIADFFTIDLELIDPESWDEGNCSIDL